MTRVSLSLATAGLAMSLMTICVLRAQADHWSASDIETLRALSLGQLPPLPASATNAVADDAAAAAFGRQLFFDTRLSANGQVSCATCHDPVREFQDGRPLAVGVGTTARRTMPLAATAFSPFLFWDGRKDSLWAQALGPLESAVEHGGHRAQYALVIARHYRAEYEALFGALPDLTAVAGTAGPAGDPAAREAWQSLSPAGRDDVTRVFVNIGKAIEAYERTLTYAASRFDRFVDILVATGTTREAILDADEIAGLRLFIGKAGCTNCHNGPLLTNQEFHNTGVPASAGLPPDDGRLSGAAAVLSDEFNCRSRWSDDPAGCEELEYLITDDPVLTRAFKVPSLRNVARRPPYMHAGQFDTLEEVISHYNRAPAAPGGRSELKPLRLSATERRQLEAFLHTLTGEPQS